jgi:hypothetical protein
MALGMSETLANGLLNGGVAVKDYDWMKLHKTGEPGPAGTLNPATETDRQQVVYTVADNGEFTNQDDLEWLSVAANETPLYLSMWDDQTAGAFGYSGQVTSNALTAGDTFTIPAGQFSTEFPLAS